MIRPLQILLAALPVAVTAAVIIAYGVNVPFWDQWELVPLLVKQREGTLALADLFHQHNEHRMFFPNLIMVGLAPLTGWDIRAELAVSLALAVAALGVALVMVRPLLAGAGTGLRLWTPFALSLLLFSLAQWENWLWGWQIQWFLSLLATLGTVLLLDRALAARNPWPALAGAAAAAGVVQFSVASGIMLWPAGLLMILLHPRPRRLPLAAAWVVVGVASCAVFFAGWFRPVIPGSVPPLEVLANPGPLLAYIASYLVSPLVRGDLLGLAPHLYGFLMLAAVLGTAGWLLATGWQDRARLLPWLALAAFTGANALVTGLGRVVFGVAQGLGSRYVTLGQLFALSAIALGILALRRLPDGALPRVAGAGLAVLVTGLLLLAGWQSKPYLDARSGQLAAGLACLPAAASAPDSCLTLIYPDAGVVRARAAMLRDLGWSGFTGR